MEQRARSVGRDYSVIPVAVTGGIFHPKLIHLQAEEGDDDLLLVGSGNLTYPGHGGNVEVLDVLRPSLHAVAFRQAADFIHRLASTPRLSIANAGPFLETAARLTYVAERGADSEAVEFIDCLSTSGLEQLVARAQRIAPVWDEVLVLSPYHHAKGQPVQQLLSAVGARKLVVGVSTRNESCSFPFDEADGFGVRSIATQMPVTAKGGGRSLHAKWIEVRRPGAALVLSGSFNATHQSLCSITNVECGVMRLLHEASSALWADAERPEFAPNEFPERDGEATLCLFANFETPFKMVGRFVGGGELGGVWKACLQDVHAILEEGDVAVAGDGLFVWMVNAPIEEVSGDTLQVTLTQGVRQARGWVQVSRVLSMGSADRALLQSLSRVADDTSEEDEIRVVLDFIAQELGNVLRDTMPPSKPHEDGSIQTLLTSKTSETAAGITAEAFEALEDPWAVPVRYDGGLMLHSLKSGRHGWDQLRHICAALLELSSVGGREKTKGGGAHNDWPLLGSQSALVVDDEKDEREVGRLEKQLAEVHHAFDHHLKAAEVSFLLARSQSQRDAIDLGRSRLWLLAGLVELRFRLLKLGDVERTQQFMWRWLRQVCDLHLEPHQRQLLAPQVCGVAAACSLWLLETTWLSNDMVHMPKQVHRLLARFFAGSFEQERIHELAYEWLGTPFGAELTTGRTDAAQVALSEVLGEPTERQVLEKVLRDGLSPHQDIAKKVYGASNFLALQAFLAKHTPLKPGYHLVDVRSLIGCPVCDESLTWVRNDGHRELDRDINWRLRQFGFVKCMRGHYLVAKEIA